MIKSTLLHRGKRRENKLKLWEFGPIIKIVSDQHRECHVTVQFLWENSSKESRGSGGWSTSISPALGQCLCLITFITVRGTNSNLLFASLTDCELSLESLTTGGGTSWDWRLSVCAVPFILMKKELESPSSFMKDRFDDRQMTHWFWSRFPGCLNDHNILSLQCWWWVRLSLSLTLIATLKRNIC